jgi:hypothetical protein
MLGKIREDHLSKPTEGILLLNRTLAAEVAHSKIPICREPRGQLMAKLNFAFCFSADNRKKILFTSFHNFFIQHLMKKTLYHNCKSQKYLQV